MAASHEGGDVQLLFPRDLSYSYLAKQAVKNAIGPYECDKQKAFLMGSSPDPYVR